MAMERVSKGGGSGVVSSQLHEPIWMLTGLPNLASPK